MKGYKVFKPDWTCLGKQYTVGEVATQDGELVMCKNGIHFCTILADCFRYYNADPKNRLAEVEALGKVLQEDGDFKCCTNRLKVIREISIAELLKDKAFCLEVVKHDPAAVRFMKGQDREVFLAAVKQNSGMLKYVIVLKYVPEDRKTPEICMTAVQENGLALEYVPEAMKTPDICMAAVQKCGLALEYVPESLKTSKLCLTAVQQNGRALKDVPEALKTPELCLDAVKQNGRALKYVPEAIKTPKLCLTAVKRDGWALEFVTEQTPEICKAAVCRNWRVLKFVKGEALYNELLASIFTASIFTD